MLKYSICTKLFNLFGPLCYGLNRITVNPIGLLWRQEIKLITHYYDIYVYICWWHMCDALWRRKGMSPYRRDVHLLRDDIQRISRIPLETARLMMTKMHTKKVVFQKQNETQFIFGRPFVPLKPHLINRSPFSRGLGWKRSTPVNGQRFLRTWALFKKLYILSKFCTNLNVLTIVF